MCIRDRLWGNRFPAGDLHQVAYMLFCCDNPPGTTEISGAQDTVGLVFPGLARSDYAGTYWPHHIEHLADESALRFVEALLYLVPLGPRHDNFAVLSDTRITPDGARALAEATDNCWQAILEQDAGRFGDSVRRSFDAQIAMFPRMVTPVSYTHLDVYKRQDLSRAWL